MNGDLVLQRHFIVRTTLLAVCGGHDAASVLTKQLPKSGSVV